MPVAFGRCGSTSAAARKPPQHLDAVARRGLDLAGWHVEGTSTPGTSAGLAPTLAALPTVSIDHLGPPVEGPPHPPRLVEPGADVKATGFGPSTWTFQPCYEPSPPANPHALMFGTDLPSTRAPRPFTHGDIELLDDALEFMTSSGKFTEAVALIP